MSNSAIFDESLVSFFHADSVETLSEMVSDNVLTIERAMQYIDQCKCDDQLQELLQKDFEHLSN